MKKRISEAIKHPLISGSVIIFVGTTFANGFNYLFQLYMGRSLSVLDYGILSSLISVINVFGVFSTTIVTVFAKFSAVFVGQKKTELVGTLLRKGVLWVGAIGLVVMLLLILFSPVVASFLRINDTFLIVVTSILIFFMFLTSVAHGILQGLLKFGLFSILNSVTAFLKFSLAVLFVLAGLKVYGGIDAFVVSALLGCILSFVALSRFLNLKLTEEIIGLRKDLFSYGFFVFLSGLGLTLFTSLDIILVKHFFSGIEAGKYAALSLMGRSIFFAVTPISFALFPLVAQKKERKENVFNTAVMSVALVALPCIALSFVYFMFPKLVLDIFFPSSQYAELAPLLGPFSLAIFFFSLSWLLNNFYLSLGHTRIFILTLISVLLELIYIVFFHQSLSQVIFGLIIISFLLLLSLLLYYPKVIAQPKNAKQ